MRDILVMQARYYSAMQNSDIFATRNIFRVANVVESTRNKSSRRAVRGISLAVRQISQAVLISQIREDLYRFSLSAFGDKLNFPRALSPETYPREARYRLCIRTWRISLRLLRAFSDYRRYRRFF